MSKLSIVYAHQNISAIIINDQHYYADIINRVLYDDHLCKLVVPNLNQWLQYNTQNEYSYRDLCHMSDAFQDGLSHTHTDDIHKSVQQIVDYTIDEIFKTDALRGYASAFWVELLDPSKFHRLEQTIRDNFDALLNKHGSDKIYHIMCRMLHLAHMHNISEAPVIASLIKNQLHRSPHGPQYPDTSTINTVVGDAVLNNLQHLNLPGGSEHIIRNVMQLSQPHG